MLQIQSRIVGKRKNKISLVLGFLFLVRSGVITLSFQLITSWPALLKQPCEWVLKLPWLSLNVPGVPGGWLTQPNQMEIIIPTGAEVYMYHGSPWCSSYLLSVWPSDLLKWILLAIFHWFIAWFLAHISEVSTPSPLHEQVYVLNTKPCAMVAITVPTAAATTNI